MRDILLDIFEEWEFQFMNSFIVSPKKIEFCHSLNYGIVYCQMRYIIIIDEEMFVWSKCGNLQNIWSMRVQDFFELRVGRVILGKKLLVHIRSKNKFLFNLFVKDLYWSHRLSQHIYFPFGVC